MFQPRATVPAIAPHQATKSLRETSEDVSFSSQGGMIANATLGNSVADRVLRMLPKQHPSNLISQCRSGVNQMFGLANTQKYINAVGYGDLVISMWH